MELLDRLVDFFIWMARYPRMRRLEKRRREGLCYHCGYDVRDTIGVCPECGRYPYYRKNQAADWPEIVDDLEVSFAGESIEETSDDNDLKDSSHVLNYGRKRYKTQRNPGEISGYAATSIALSFSGTVLFVVLSFADFGEAAVLIITFAVACFLSIVLGFYMGVCAVNESKPTIWSWIGMLWNLGLLLFLLGIYIVNSIK